MWKSLLPHKVHFEIEKFLQREIKLKTFIFQNSKHIKNHLTFAVFLSGLLSMSNTHRYQNMHMNNNVTQRANYKAEALPGSRFMSFYFQSNLAAPRL